MEMNIDECNNNYEVDLNHIDELIRKLQDEKFRQMQELKRIMKNIETLDTEIYKAKINNNIIENNYYKWANKEHNYLDY